MSRLHVTHLITRLIVGGAQTNTAYTALKHDQSRFQVSVVSGPSADVGGGELVSWLQQGDVTFVETPNLTTPVNPIKDLLALVEIYRLLKQLGTDILHTHGSKAGILGRLAARAAGVPVIIHTIHGWGFSKYSPVLARHLFPTMERVAARYTDAFIAVSGTDIHKGLSRGIGRHGLYHVIRSGIDLGRFVNAAVDTRAKRLELGLNPDWPLVCMVGRLSPQKNPLDFVRTCALVTSEVGDVSFLLVGDGPMRGDVENLIKELGLGVNMRIVGTRSDVHEVLFASDVVALSSLWEGLPRTIPEAMAASRPVVCTAVDGSVEAVEDGVTGFLVEPKNPAEMADRIVRLLSEPKLGERMGAAGRKKVDPEFCVDHMVSQIESLYAQLIQRKITAKALTSSS